MVRLGHIPQLCLGLATAVVAFETSALRGGNYVSAIGIGTKDREQATKFYSSVFGFKKLIPFSIPEYKEDILINLSGGPALVTMKWADKRPTEDLPIKLQFTCKTPVQTRNAVVTAGGSMDMTLKTESNPTALYARDLDGYLLELLPASGDSKLRKGCILTSIGVGTQDLDKAATFWSKSLGLPAGPVKHYAEWSSVSFKPATNAEFVLMSYNETPRRSTEKLPYKIVIGASDTKGLVSSIKAAGGEAGIDNKGSIGIGSDPVDHNMIEINKGLYIAE